jgi:glycosyltransferase involved in cell wall biosynthesis
MPTISVILPVYNASEFLLEALESLTNQTYKDFEIIALNDGSTDNSLEILKEYAEKEPRLKIYSRENRGLPKTLNECVDYAKGEYIARMDADDISLPERFEKQLDFLEKNNLDLCGTQHKCFGITNQQSDFPTTEASCNIGLLFYCILSHPTIMGKTSIFRKYRYNENLDCAQDYDLWSRMAAGGVKINNLSQVLLKYRINSNQISERKKSKQELNSVNSARIYWNNNQQVKKYLFYSFMRSYNPVHSNQLPECIKILNEFQNKSTDEILYKLLSKQKSLLLTHIQDIKLSVLLPILKSCKDLNLSKKIYIILLSVFNISKIKKIMNQNKKISSCLRNIVDKLNIPLT